MISKKLSITFVSPKRYSFYPPDYEGRGLGGSESALVLLSRALAKKGHNVDVYNCCYKPGKYDGVEWKPLWMFNPLEQRDAVVSLRLLETFEQDVAARVRAVWIHDDSLPGATKMDSSGKVNRWIAVSETEKVFIEQKEKISPEHWFITNNAFDEDIYNDGLRGEKKIPGQLIYCSAPDRGLQYLLEYWEEIKKRAPYATLLITGSFALWGNADEENERFFGEMYKKALELDGVRLLGRIEKKELALHQAQSEIMVYPSTFDEMYCISALECLAVGTPIVSTARAAMKERVIPGETGFLIDGHPKEPQYRKNFIDAIFHLLDNPEELKSFSQKAVDLAKSENYGTLADRWETEFNRILLKERG